MYLAGLVKRNIVEAEVDLVQKPRVEKVSKLPFLVKEPSLGKERLECRTWQWPIGDRGRVMRIKIRCMHAELLDRVAVASPEVILRNC